MEASIQNVVMSNIKMNMNGIKTAPMNAGVENFLLGRFFRKANIRHT
jgi:hypothetical protein